jgi:hypothetical protein
MEIILVLVLPDADYWLRHYHLIAVFNNRDGKNLSFDRSLLVLSLWLLWFVSRQFTTLLMFLFHLMTFFFASRNL